MGPTPSILRVLALAALAAGVCGSGTWHRKLAQDATTVINSPLYRPTSDGSLVLASNYTVSIDRRGNTVLGQISASRPGFTYTLPYGYLRSSIIQDASCIQASLVTSGRSVGALLLTYADYLADASDGFISVRSSKVVGNLNLTSSTPGPVTATVDPNTSYVLVLYNLDQTSALARYTLTAYAPGSRCSASPPASSSSPFTVGAFGPSSSPPSLTRTVQLQLDRNRTQITIPAGFTNASCIAYRLAVLPPQLGSSSDNVTVFVLEEADLLRWAGDQLDLTATYLRLIAPCNQSITAPRTCGAYVDKLDPTKTYFVLSVAGLRSTRSLTANVNFALTAQASGSCATNAVQTYVKSSSSLQPASSPPRPSPPSPSTGTNSTIIATSPSQGGDPGSNASIGRSPPPPTSTSARPPPPSFTSTTRAPPPLSSSSSPPAPPGRAVPPTTNSTNLFPLPGR